MGDPITEVLPEGEGSGSFQSHEAKTLTGLTWGTGAMKQAEMIPQPVLCNVMTSNRLTIVLAQRPEMDRRWGQVTLQGNPELPGVPAVMPGRGPGETGMTPLPTSTASGEAPPSTGVSGASSSRSVARLYSTICQTVGRQPRSGRESCAPTALPRRPLPGRAPPA